VHRTSPESEQGFDVLLRGELLTQIMLAGDVSHAHPSQRERRDDAQSAAAINAQ
jgi:hypothetical protein